MKSFYPKCKDCLDKKIVLNPCPKCHEEDVCFTRRFIDHSKRIKCNCEADPLCETYFAKNEDFEWKVECNNTQCKLSWNCNIMPWCNTKEEATKTWNSLNDCSDKFCGTCDSCSHDGYQRISINLKDIDYPILLGTTPNLCSPYGCAIYSYFYQNDITPVWVDNISINDMLKNHQTHKFNKMCLKSEHCGPIIKNMLEGSYKDYVNNDPNDIDEEIRVKKAQEGSQFKYEVVEGKHRICMAKRFLKEKGIAVVICEKEIS
jgi:hypothetical protein